MRVFIDGVRPLGGLPLDGLAWGTVVGAAAPLLVGLVGGVLGGSPQLLLIGVTYALVGAVVGALTGLAVGLTAGVLFELWTLLRVPGVVVALGTVLPVLAVFYVLSGGDEGVGSWAFVPAVLAGGPLVADVIHRARRLDRERESRRPVHDARSWPVPQDAQW